MNEPFEPGPIPTPDSFCPAEVLLREYLEDLFRALDCERIHDSCACERALASVIRGVVEPLALSHATMLTYRDLAEIAFGELEDRFGWYGDDAAVLELYSGVWPTTDDDDHPAAEERYRSDPYSRHARYWHRCMEAGYADVSDWFQRRDDPRHTRVAMVVTGAASAVGDE